MMLAKALVLLFILKIVIIVIWSHNQDTHTHMYTYILSTLGDDKVVDDEPYKFLRLLPCHSPCVLKNTSTLRLIVILYIQVYIFIYIYK